MISLEYDKNDERLITPENALKFNIQYKTRKENITLQLENILNPKKIETVGSKIKNVSILVTKRKDLVGTKWKMPNITDEFKIEGLQNFGQYTKIYPIRIKISNSEIQNALALYSKKYNYRFIANNLLFSSSIQQDTNVAFITTTGLNDAKEILINGKIFQGIAIIYLSEVNGWKNIIYKSHWSNTVFTDSEYPVAAKHFALGFETTDLHNLLNFGYSLVDEKGI